MRTRMEWIAEDPRTAQTELAPQLDVSANTLEQSNSSSLDAWDRESN
jgi:hypothetical protein